MIITDHTVLTSDSDILTGYLVRVSVLVQVVMFHCISDVLRLRDSADLVQ